MTASTSTFKLNRVLRKATDRIIKLDYRTIVLVPHKEIKTPSGAKKKEPQTPRAAQTFSITPIDAGYSGVSSNQASGEAASDFIKGHIWWYWMVGRYNAIVEINDSWTDGDMTYQVVVKRPENGYETRCLVRAFGSEPNYGQ